MLLFHQCRHMVIIYVITFIVRNIVIIVKVIQQCHKQNIASDKAGFNKLWQGIHVSLKDAASHQTVKHRQTDGQPTEY